MNVCLYATHSFLQPSTASSQDCLLHPAGDPVLLQRGVLDKEKNSEVVKALMRANPSYTSSATFSALLGVSKDDTCEQKKYIVVVHTDTHTHTYFFSWCH